MFGLERLNLISIAQPYYRWTQKKTVNDANTGLSAQGVSKKVKRR